MQTDPLTLARHFGWALAGAFTVTLGAWLAFPLPGTDIPQTGQTIAVLLCGACLGAGRGALAIGLYCLLGGLGLPMFSDGGAGWAVLFGGSAGYFAGFAVAAAVSGWLLSPWLQRHWGRILAVMLLGHGLILALGWAWMARDLGPAEAFVSGVQPFIIGGVGKSLLTTGLLESLRQLHNRGLIPRPV